MNRSRAWTLGAVVAIVAIIAGAVGLGVQPELASASTADTSTAGVRAQNTATELQLARLAKAAATESTLKAQDTKLSSAVTGSIRLSTFSRQVRDLAALDGVSLTSLSPSAGTPYAPAVAAGSATTSKTSTGASASGVFGKTNPLITAANFVIIPVTLIVTGSEAATIQFSSDVQHMNRLFAVSTVSYAKGTADGTPPSTTISGNIYALKR